jgi:hypothetical protein
VTKKESYWLPAINHVSRIGKYLERLNYTTYCLVLSVGFLFKTGIRGIQPWQNFSAVEEFPVPVESFSANSFGLLVLCKLFQIDDKLSFFILNCIIFSTFLAFLYLLLFRKFKMYEAKILVLILVSSPVFTVLTGNIGRHDLLSIMGMLFFLLSEKFLSKVMGLTIACLGSPEHVFSAFLIYLLGALILKEKNHTSKGLLAVGFSLVFTVLASSWVSYNAAGQNRFYNIISMTEFAELALRNFANNFLLEWYTYFGMYWVVLIASILLLKKQTRIKIIILLLFPMLFNVIMVDKTRDFVIAMLPFSLLILNPAFRWFSDKMTIIGNAQKEFYFGFFFCLCVAFPSIEITFEGQPRAPFYWLINKLMEISF